MAEFYLVRHGQASFGAANYDKLSELGHQQATWLGEYFAQRQISFAQAFCGDMVRHQETAAGIMRSSICSGQLDIHSGLNEFDFNIVVKAYLALHPEQRPAPDAPRTVFYSLLKQAMGAWSSGQLEDPELPETWQHFNQRVADALQVIRSVPGNKPSLVVSSGGAMSLMLGQILGVDNNTVINLNLQIRNASYSHFYFNQKGIHLSSFNNVPHLDHPDRPNAVTYS